LILPFTNLSCASLGWAVILPHQGFSFAMLRVEFSAVPGGYLVSEYQYYEFRTIDRPLTEAEMDALRSISSRAEITSTGFTNHYEWGDLKADPFKLLEKYFDAFVYMANWGVRRFWLRLPKAWIESGLRTRGSLVPSGICWQQREPVKKRELKRSKRNVPSRWREGKLRRKQNVRDI
jgi:hypothetical protein